MKFIQHNQPRKFSVGGTVLSDCGEVYLNSDEQITFVSESGKRHDFCAKKWGFYATPSVNHRLSNQNLKTALVKNLANRYYVMVVDEDYMDEFSDYLNQQGSRVLEWLDEKKAAIEINYKDIPAGKQDISLKSNVNRDVRRSSGFWTRYYQWFFKRKGIKYGKGLKVMGPLVLRLDGNPRNIIIGRNVTLMPYADLKIRENGKIILGDGVVLDTISRIVAARNGAVELGDDAQIGMGSIINGGDDVIIGCRTMISGFCTIIASEHRYDSEGTLLSQGYHRSPVMIGEDSWVAANVIIRPGSRLGKKTVVGAKSVVDICIPSFCLAVGNPAKIVKCFYSAG